MNKGIILQLPTSIFVLKACRDESKCVLRTEGGQRIIDFRGTSQSKSEQDLCVTGLEFLVFRLFGYTRRGGTGHVTCLKYSAFGDFFTGHSAWRLGGLISISQDLFIEFWVGVEVLGGIKNAG